MNYLQFVNNVLETAKSHKLVYEVGEGDIYEHLNSGDHKYPCVFLTVQNIDSNGSQMTVTGSIFYVDALLSDSSNKLQIQATGMTTLQQIFMRLMDNYPDFDLRTGRYTPFDEKFSDLCAGVFSNFTVSFMDDICIVNDDIFEGDVPTPPTPPEPEEKYMTITVDDVEGETTISPTVTGNLPNLNLQYRINNGEWSDFIVGTTADIKVVAGDAVQFKGVNESGLSIDYDNYLNFVVSGNPVALSGNVMSLIDGVGDALEIPNNYCFYALFRDSAIKTVSSDFLPATTLSDNCYQYMFSGCTSLTQAPELPATTLAEYCYYVMFSGCTSLVNAQEILPANSLAESCYYLMFENCSSLTQAPELPATTLAGSCYYGMFRGCTSLVTLPELHATTLAPYCYYSMFENCSSLTQAHALPATTLSSNCYRYMFSECTSLVNAPSLPATTLATYCYGSMFQMCSSLATAPELPATTVAESCYQNMFYGCTSLVTAPELPATTLTTSCYYRMFQGCTALENAPVLPATKLSDSCYGNMFAGCSKLVNAPALPATTIIDNCYSSMFYNCTALVNAPELPATTVAKSCYSYMFSQCIALVNAPELPATTLADNCYSYMFYGCTSLVNVPKILPATTLADSCYKFMFYNCTALVNAPELPATTLAYNCYMSMFYYCTALVNAPELPATTLADYCYENMFYYCTSLVNAPVLPATTLSNRCYSGMFYNCNNLNYVKCLATDISASRALNNWLSGVASTGTFVKKYGVEYLINSPSGIPEGWTVEEIDAPIPPEPEGKYMTMTVLDGDVGETIIEPKFYERTITPPNLQYRVNNGSWKDFVFGTTAAITAQSGDVIQWKGLNPNGISAVMNNYLNYLNFSISGNPVALSGSIMSLIDGVGETTVIPCDYCFTELFSNANIKTISDDFLPALTLKSHCYDKTFYNCKNLEKAPLLPAKELKLECYQGLFQMCSKLNYVKCLATKGTYFPSASTTTGWLNGVSSTGTFEKPAEAEYLMDSGSGIPSGWTVVNI